MSWIHGPRATFDLETTGVDVETARIVTASLLLLNPDGSVRRAGEWLADPGVEIPEAAAAVHGVTTEYARAHGQPAQQVVWELAGAIGSLFLDGVPVIAFNAAYDFSVLHHEMKRYSIANGSCPAGASLTRTLFISTLFRVSAATVSWRRWPWSTRCSWIMRTLPRTMP